MKNVARRALAVLRDGFALVGLAAVCAGTLFVLDGDALRVVLPGAAGEASAAVVAPAPAAPQGPTAAGRVASPLEDEQRAITAYIAKRYRVSDVAVADYVAAAYRAGAQYSLDPLLILAVMAIESAYNPVAESVVGAKGLMQVMPKFHLEKLADHGGEDALLQPQVNILVGARILREYQRRFRDLEDALQMYAGAFDDPASQYANKVLAEKARLELLRQRVRKDHSA
ncbi:MAG TPA: transglycosylase SLT domain-containing protein [Burkholderiales bacterium]